MIDIYSVIVEGVDRPGCSSLMTKFQMLKGRCRIILQVACGNWLLLLFTIISSFHPYVFPTIWNGQNLWINKSVINLEDHPLSFVNALGFCFTVHSYAAIFIAWKLIDALVIPIQVHDELVLEVDPSVVKEAALLLQMGMENAALLLGICSVSIVHISLYSENLSFLYFISLFVFQFLCMSNWK